ncbi:MAG: XdhC family protein [Myxococcota bacterium]
MSGPAPIDFARRYLALAESGEPFVVATVVDVEGSVSARPGAKALLDREGGVVLGWIGGGCAESAVRDAALEALADRATKLLHLDLDDEVLGVGMPCGGRMSVYVEPVIPAARLCILGHGAIAETLCALAHLVDLQVTVNDPLATDAAFPGADLRIIDDPDYTRVECDASTYVVVTTQHRTDFEALESVLPRRPAWVGVVASRKRSALLLERLAEAGFPSQVLERIAAPCGLDLGARTPSEIALSIVAEILWHMRGEPSARPLAQVKGVRIREGRVEVPAGPVPSERCPR